MQTGQVQTVEQKANGVWRAQISGTWYSAWPDKVDVSLLQQGATVSFDSYLAKGKYNTITVLQAGAAPAAAPAGPVQQVASAASPAIAQLQAQLQAAMQADQVQHAQEEAAKHPPADQSCVAGILKSAIEHGLIPAPEGLEAWASAATAALERRHWKPRTAPVAAPPPPRMAAPEIGAPPVEASPPVEAYADDGFGDRDIPF